MRLACDTEQSQVNLVHPPRATDLRRAQNKIIICGIDLCEGLNQGPDTMLYHTASLQASGNHLTFNQAFFIFETELKRHIHKLIEMSKNMKKIYTVFPYRYMQVVLARLCILIYSLAKGKNANNITSNLLMA